MTALLLLGLYIKQEKGGVIDEKILAEISKVPEKVKLSLYYLDSQEKISTTRTAKQLEDAVKEIFKVREEIEKSDFKCSDHIFCQMGCEFSLFCKSD